VQVRAASAGRGELRALWALTGPDGAERLFGSLDSTLEAAGDEHSLTVGPGGPPVLPGELGGPDAVRDRRGFYGAR
jgi:hypothetical protein